MIRMLALLLSLLFAGAAHSAPIENGDGFWSEWNDATFARAAREKKFVIMTGTSALSRIAVHSAVVLVSRMRASSA